MNLEEKDLISIEADEQLARFILFSKWVRPSDRTVKSEAFIPHPYPDLSVTRHKNLSEQGLWQIGQDVARLRDKELYGRADINALAVRQQKLDVVPKPIIPENPNHANIIDWPAEKHAQKIIALQLAKESVYIANPKNPTS